MNRRKFERWLREHGATFVRHGSRHDLWHREDREATVPRHREIKTGTANAICDQLRIARPPER